MKYLHTLFFSCALAALLLVPTASAEAQTTAATASLLAQIQQLKTQLQALEQKLLLRGASPVQSLSDCYTDAYGRRYCVASSQQFDDADDIDAIEVDFVGDIAQVRVEFDDDDDKFYALEADTVSEAAQILARELNLSVATALRLIDEVDNDDRDNNDDDDIRSIDVNFDGDDADVTVRLRDGDTDRFTLRNVNDDEDDVIEEIADRYNEDEDNVEDLTDFDDDNNRNDDDDIRNITVDFTRDDADVFVRFEDGDTERFILRNVDDDEDEVIELLADRYNMDEDDIEDAVDFE